MFLLFFIIYLIMAMKNIKLYLLFTLCFTFVLLKKSNLRNTLDYSLENKEYQIHSYINDDNFNDTNIPTNELNKTIDIKPENTNEKKDNFPERYDNFTEKMDNSTQRNDNITEKNQNEEQPNTNKNETKKEDIANKNETNKEDIPKNETKKEDIANKNETKKEDIPKNETKKEDIPKNETKKEDIPKSETKKEDIPKNDPRKDVGKNEKQNDQSGQNKDNKQTNKKPETIGFWEKNWPWFMLGAVGLFALAIIIFMIYYITIKQYGDLDKKVKTISFRNEREDDEEDGGDLLK